MRIGIAADHAGFALREAVAISHSGVGASIVANKVPGVRADFCHDTFPARRGVEREGMNLLGFGAHVVGAGSVAEMVVEFFSGDEKSVRRLDRIEKLEWQQHNTHQPQTEAAL